MPATERPPSRRRAKQPLAPRESSTGPVDVILVGCSELAQQSYASALHALQEANLLRVHALVDPVESLRESCLQRFPRATAAPSLDSVVAPPNALAIIATSARFHAAQSSAALKRGWHVLCGVPFATTAREAAQMIAAAQRHERILAVDLPQRFFPAARYLRTLCRDHLLGQPSSFRIHEGTTASVADVPGAASHKVEMPDGVLSEPGVRALDLLTWCLGSPTVRRYADDAMGGVEANAFIELGFPEEVHGTVHLSRDWPTEQSYTFVFERGIVRWDATGPDRITLQIGSAPAALQGELVTPLSARHSHRVAPLLTDQQQAVAAEIQNILGAIARREPLRVPATEAMHSLHIIEECYARRTPLPQPWLPQNESVHARAFAPPTALRRP